MTEQSQAPQPELCHARCLCVECGPDVLVDEDGCCVTCGGTAVGTWLDEHPQCAIVCVEVARATRERDEEIARLKMALSSEDIAYRDCLAKLTATESNIVSLARAVESVRNSLRDGPWVNCVDSEIAKLSGALAEADVDTTSGQEG